MSIFQTVKEQFANVGLDCVMGYFRPYSQFNKGKKSEFDERVWFKEDKENTNGQRNSIE